MGDAFIIMGVAGCGKTSVGHALAERIGIEYLDGDSLHPMENITKMSKGIPLNDDDRWPWLGLIGQKFHTSPDNLTTNNLAIGCSALKRCYRDHIVKSANRPVCFIHLTGDYDLIASRMASRENHFMPVKLLDSQFADLEELQADEFGFKVSIDQDISRIIDDICTQIKDTQNEQ